MARLRHLFLGITLALSLAIGQHAVLLHALHHAGEVLAHDGAPSDTSNCEGHVLFVSAASALGCEPLAAPLVAAVLVPARVAATPCAVLPPRFGFHSRAPPASLA